MSTITITASDVNKLRQQTGAGMMDCRAALQETNGDFEAAIDFLRKNVAGRPEGRGGQRDAVLARLRCVRCGREPRAAALARARDAVPRR